MRWVSFAERMEGWYAFGADGYNDALLHGRRDGTTCAVDLRIVIADLDGFLADPQKTAVVTGTVACGAVGGTTPVLDGVFNMLAPVGGDPRFRRMTYRLHVANAFGQPVTLTGFKDVSDGLGFDAWSDTTTLFMALCAGHVDDAQDVVGSALGVLRISPLGLARQLASLRAKGGVATLARFGIAFFGALGQVYGAREHLGDTPDFPDAAFPRGGPFRGQKPGAWYDVPGHEGLERRILPLTATDGAELTLHHVRNAKTEPTGPPVLCLHGTGVRGDMFVGPPGGPSVARLLSDAGYDVWIANWRASIDLPPRPYTLDDAAVFDHPAAIAAVREHTQAERIRVFAHCQGSTSFTMTALSGLAGDVSHVLSSAVSLHPVVPWRSRVKLLVFVPLLRLRLPYVSAQWGIRPPTRLARLVALLARLVRRECRNPVCALGNYTYGTGPDVLWRHAQLGPVAHEWSSREFGFVPLRFLRQMSRCVDAGHLVPAGIHPELAADLLAAPIPESQRWTFMTGQANRLYLMESQILSHAHFVAGAKDEAEHELHLVPGYGHLDSIFSPNAVKDVFPVILAALED